jgi:hypothetical protein
LRDGGGFLERREDFMERVERGFERRRRIF